MQTRRSFIKKGCAACFGMSAFGILLQSCASSQHIFKGSIHQKILSIPLEKFNTERSLIVRNADLEFDILVMKKEEGFGAVQMRCTHNDVALSFSGKKLICNAHGSEFDLQGNVLREPAAKSLTTYRTTIDGQQLSIHLL